MEDLKKIYLPFNKNDKVIIGVSTGKDSMCLLDFLYQNGYQVIICHVNHKKRIASEFEEEFIKNYASKRNIPCEIYHLPKNLVGNFQEQARIKRYEFFMDVAKKYNAKYILTAHHLNDNAETLLIKLIRGTGLKGFSGIKPQQNLGDYVLVRPLYSISRLEIDNYIKTYNIPFFEDESNDQNDYLRNRVRHDILPLLEKENPNILNNLNNFSNTILESFSFLRLATQNFLKNSNEIDINEFKKLHIALKKDIILYLLETKGIKSSNIKINNILKLIESAKAQGELAINSHYLFIKSYEKAYLKERETIIKETCVLSLECPVIYKNKYKFYLTKNPPNKDAKFIKLCYNNLNMPLYIRQRENGDFFEFSYGHKKLKNFLIDRKIPKEKRDKLIIIADAQGCVIWAYDLAYSKQDLTQDIIYLICEVKNNV